MRSRCKVVGEIFSIRRTSALFSHCLGGWVAGTFNSSLISPRSCRRNCCKSSRVTTSVAIGSVFKLTGPVSLYGTQNRHLRAFLHFSLLTRLLLCVHGQV